MSDPIKSISSAKNSTLLLCGYCLLISPLLTVLSYVIDWKLILPESYHVEQLHTISQHLQVAALCSYLLLAESIISLVTIIRKCLGYRLYFLIAWTFIVVRLAVVSVIIYDDIVSYQHQRPSSQQLWRLEVYAILIGLFEMMIVGLQIGTISRLRRKLQNMSKSPEEEV